MKDTVTVMMDVGVETTVRGEMKGAIEAAKGIGGSKGIVTLDDGGVELLNEIGTGSFIGDELNLKATRLQGPDQNYAGLCGS